MEKKVTISLSDVYDKGCKTGRKDVVEAILSIIANPKKAGYRLREITEYCETQLDITTSDVLQ